MRHWSCENRAHERVIAMTDTVDNPAYRTRLSVLFASAAPKAVILRRGPKTHWHLIAWDLDTDTFTSGQWMKGLVTLCDLSPTGGKLIYWAAQLHASAVRRSGPQPYDPLRAGPPNPARKRRKVPRYIREPGGLRRSPHPVQGTWTAISTPPYFSALAIWPAYGRWTGGGLFHSEREIFLREPEDRMIPIENVAIPPTVRIRSLYAPGAPGPVGMQRRASAPSHGGSQDGGPWQALASSGATWVDWLHVRSNEELLFACDGCVYRLRGWRDLPADRYLAEASLLADLRDMRFSLLPAPSEAMRW
jgi:hypothetical protein